MGFTAFLSSDLEADVPLFSFRVPMFGTAECCNTTQEVSDIVSSVSAPQPLHLEPGGAKTLLHTVGA